MSTSEMVAQHLPYLRRYARALGGSQEAGDAYVVAALETLIEDSSLLHRCTTPRLALYRVFTKIWNSVHLRDRPEPSDPSLPVEQRLGQITRLPRQAFLLLALERFTEEEAAQILDVDVAVLRTLADESGRELALEIATDVLIIEDEPFIGLDLEELIESLGHSSLGVARTHVEAIALARAKRPGIILADIKLADGSSGLEAVNELLRSFEVPVVFITAYPERFLTGTRPEPAFLITKPYQRATLSAVMSQALFFEHNAKPPSRPAHGQPEPPGQASG